MSDRPFSEHGDNPLAESTDGRNQQVDETSRDEPSRDASRRDSLTDSDTTAPDESAAGPADVGSAAAVSRAAGPADVGSAAAVSRDAGTEAGATGLDEAAQRELDSFRSAFEQERPVSGSAADDRAAVRHADARSETQRQKVPGPGIPEALAWTAGMIGVHIAATIATMIVVVAVQAMKLSTDGTPPSPGTLQTQLDEMPQQFGVELMTGEMLIFVVVAIFAAWLRLGRGASRRLALRSIAPGHLGLICAAAIPLSLFCGGLHEGLLTIWEQYFADLPGMSVFDKMNVNEMIRPVAENTSVGMLLLVIALAPAIGEELIFRGVIGRGLIARHGVFAGVTMTALLFASVHVHPAHVLALLPLAFFIHVVYLATRSFLAPMLLHLLNNSLAVVLLKVADTNGGGSALDTDAGMPWPVLVIAAVAVGLAAWSLWRSRAEYRCEDGSIWDPGYPTVEVPPPSVQASMAYRECPEQLYRTAIGLTGIISLGFLAMLGAMLSGNLPG